MNYNMCMQTWDNCEVKCREGLGTIGVSVQSLHRDSKMLRVASFCCAYILDIGAYVNHMTSMQSMREWRMTIQNYVPVNSSLLVREGSYDDSVGQGSCTGEKGIISCQNKGERVYQF